MKQTLGMLRDEKNSKSSKKPKKNDSYHGWVDRFTISCIYFSFFYDHDHQEGKWRESKRAC